MKILIVICFAIVSIKAFANDRYPYNEVIKIENAKSRSDQRQDEKMSELFWTYVMAQKYLLDFDYMLGVPGISPYGLTATEKGELDEIKRQFEASGNIELIFQSRIYKKLLKLRVISEEVEHEIAHKYIEAVEDVFKIQLMKERYPQVGKVFPAELQAQLDESVNFILSVKGLFGADIEALRSDESLRVQFAVLENLKSIQTELSKELFQPVTVTPKTSQDALSRRDKRFQEIAYMRELDFTPEQTTEWGQKYIRFLNREAASIRWERSEISSYLREQAGSYLIHKNQFENIPNERKKSLEDVMSKLVIADREGVDRYPNSNLFEPSVSSKGNIYGRRFPTNVFALTYDDGPNNGSSKKILDLLVQHEVKATFFVLTKMINNYRNTANEIKEMGMEIASHSYTHINFMQSSIPMSKKRYEINTAVDHLEGALDVDVKYFRFPYGNGTNNNVYRQMLADRKLIHVHWNVDSLDWKDRNPVSVFNRVIRQMAKVKRGVLLFHDIHNSTFEASKLLLDHFKNNNTIKLCTVGSIINEMETGADCRSSDDRPIDISSSIENDLNDVCEKFRERSRSVWSAVGRVLDGKPYQSSNRCISGETWHSVSTPRSDERRIEQLFLLERKHQRMKQSDAKIYVSNDVRELLEQVFDNDNSLEERFCEINYDDINPSRVVDLGQIYRAAKTRKLSFNPHDNIHLRWGVELGDASNCTVESNPSYYGYPNL